MVKKNKSKKANKNYIRVIPDCNKIFTLPNCLTLLRIILAPFFMLALLNNQNLLALIIIAIASVTDFLDGWAARRFRMESDLGRMLDPVADKILIFFSVVALLIKFNFPLWIGLIIIGRDVLILLGGLLFIYRKEVRLLKPNMLGKISTFFQMTTITIYILASIFSYYIILIDILLYLTVIMAVLSGISYIMMSYKILSTKH